MHRGRCYRRVAQPYRLVAPASRFGRRLQGTAKKCPLHAELAALIILEVGGDVPPFDAKTIMRAMIRREAEHPAGHNLGKRGGLFAKAGEPLLHRRRLIATSEQRDGQA
ncbi:hypothetical protein D3C76_1275190 [compost metagenome]